MLLPDQTALEHVRLRRSPKQPRIDPTIARLRLSHLLGSASLQPPAMPPSAILLVRAMADPLPGKITREFAPAALASDAWQRAAQDQLGAFYRAAAHPASGPVPPGAEAVVFADYGELLACLSRDLAAGSTLGWWWKSIARRTMIGLPGSWVSAWAEQPSAIPAALDYLHKWKQAAAVLQRISPVQAWNLLWIVLRAFELPELILPRPSAPTPVPPQDMPPRLAIAALQSPPAAVPVSAPLARQQQLPLPWEPYLSSAVTPPELGYERQALLGIGLLLRRFPAAIFRSTFAPRFRAWLKQTRSPESANAAASPSVPEPSTHQAYPHQPSPPQVFESNAPQSVREKAAQPEKKLARLAKSVENATPHSLAPSSSSDPLEPDPQPRAEQTTPNRTWEAGQATRLGGIFYLIHFLRQAELLLFDHGLSGWELLELLARCLLNDASMAFDPLWTALADLDGRDVSAPAGARFVAQRTYRAPSSWLQYASPSRFARFRSRGVEIFTAEGFLVLDSFEPQDSSLLQRCTQAQRRKIRELARVRPSALAISKELRRFLHFILPFARWRLGRALGVLPLHQALLRSAKVFITSTHVDCVMPLKEISVPVRMTGLDANPGWVPELGRVVNFHFSEEGFRE